MGFIKGRKNIDNDVNMLRWLGLIFCLARLEEKRFNRLRIPDFGFNLMFLGVCLYI